MQESKIEWTDATWNPVRGCTKVSAGCKHCYAETFAERWRGIPGHAFEQGFDLRLVPEKLGEPLKWKAPKRIFVNSMSDLFHEDVPFEYIDKVFAVMAVCEQHTFQVLTKRPERMAEYCSQWKECRSIVDPRPTENDFLQPWPLPNVHLGTSVENQEAAGKRIPHLMLTPATVRFLSCEPLLGPVDLRGYLCNPETSLTAIHWVIIGGESGHHARPMELEWARELVAQCKAAQVPVFMKQLGGTRDKRGNIADFPPELQVREFPQPKGTNHA